MFDATKAAQIVTEAAGRMTAEAGCKYAESFTISDPYSPHPLFVVVFSDIPDAADIAKKKIELNIEHESPLEKLMQNGNQEA